MHWSHWRIHSIMRLLYKSCWSVSGGPTPSDNMDMLRHRRHRARHLSVAKWCCHAPETSQKQWIRESYQLHWCETFHISTILTASCSGNPMPMHCTRLCEWWQAPSSRQRIRCGEVQIKLNRCKSIVIGRPGRGVACTSKVGSLVTPNLDRL